MFGGGAGGICGPPIGIMPGGPLIPGGRGGMCIG